MSHSVITVETPARLHFGLLDLWGVSGRRYGGIGAPAPGITARLSATHARSVDVRGEDADRAADYARRFLARHGIRDGVRIEVERAIPPHAGLGSGTQLALCVARALAELHDIEASAPELARSVGRARRSAVGTWTFAGGGFIVEGGHRIDDADATPPLVSRVSFPERWHCVVVVPDAEPGVSGEAEASAFDTLPAPNASDVDHIATLVLLRMLPALAEDDIVAFGAALTEVQEINGHWFASAQGGTFAPGASTMLIDRLREWGAAGVGQSSWGPTVYAVVDGEALAHDVADRARSALAGAGVVHAGPFPTTGAQVNRA